MSRLLWLVLAVSGCSAPMMTPDAGTPDACRGAVKSPPNLLENSGFECDDMPASWIPVYGTLELAAGGRSVSVPDPPGGTELVDVPPGWIARVNPARPSEIVGLVRDLF